MQGESRAQRWRRHAMHNQMYHETYHVGVWLVDQMIMDTHHGDNRLRQLVGRDWFERMMRLGLQKPHTARRVWRYIIEHRRLPVR